MSGNEGADITAEAGDLLDHARTNKRVRLLGHHKNSFNPFIELAIHEGELELELEVRDSPQTPDDRFTPFRYNIIDKEAGESVDLNIFQVLDGKGGEVLALAHGKERGFAFIDGNRDDHSIKEA